MRELVLKRCKKCKAMIKVINDCSCGDCGIKCCGECMDTVISNSVDASFEKHVPTYKIDDDKLIVEVNHVMDEDHYIEWIAFVNDEKEEYKYFNPGDKCIAIFNYSKGTLYSYCNKHMLWKNNVK